ncbi:GntR family transcriptional regulator [Halomonas sp. DP8Y7-3]|nr:GntR family transcriptional regulator [Halomonas sp. DP8Y7-3]MBY5985193.1 GntR family transcriptional regulator [Halomonas sp. DP5Y7-2]MBY6208247.1 GntR family transcriptional regulator [Halomonas sp. DP3Y7-2]MBY6229056.1 GntR family transcriptional regulator [Halomonas sp. DP3Y7-1]MCA0916961.1 GntR family transcriptional regulator [Halomonas denitrificans]
MTMPSDAYPAPFVIQRNLVDQVVDYLTESILAARFAPGERLSEAGLASELGISRAPVREAARLLESRGLLVSRPRRGFFVRSLDVAELNDVFDLRIGLERHAFERVMLRFDEDIEQSLKQQIERLCDVASGHDESAKIEEDIAFHRRVFELAGNPRLLRAFDDLSFELRLCITLITRTHDTPESIAASHWRLLDALRSGDPERCREEVDYHIGVARDSVIERLADGHSSVNHSNNHQ